MRTQFIAVIAAAALAATVPARAQVTTGPIADSIRTLEARRAQALLAADTAALSRMIGDEFVEISRIAQLRTKRDNLTEIATGNLQIRSVQYVDLSVRIYGDVAILQGIADNTGVFRGTPFSGKLRYTRVFVRRAGGWVAVAMQHTMIP
jgi:ketosteroid isomerase-like protein